MEALEAVIIYKTVSFFISIFITVVAIIQLVGTHAFISADHSAEYSGGHVYYMTFAWTVFYLINIYYG